MYKNYKIGSDGNPKYEGKSYRIEPERRNKELTEEWKRRLESDSRYALRRRPKKQNKTISINFNYIIYIVVFIGIVAILQIPNDTSKHNLDITLNNAVRDFGNEYIKPEEDNQFLHIDLNFNNKSKSNEVINANDFILTDGNGIVLNPSYIGYQNQTMEKEIITENTAVERVTFELSKDYYGELELIFDKGNGMNVNVSKFKIE